jgi:hypothetical protein
LFQSTKFLKQNLTKWPHQTLQKTTNEWTLLTDSIRLLYYAGSGSQSPISQLGFFKYVPLQWKLFWKDRDPTVLLDGCNIFYFRSLWWTYVRVRPFSGIHPTYYKIAIVVVHLLFKLFIKEASFKGKFWLRLWSISHYPYYIMLISFNFEKKKTKKKTEQIYI